MALVDNDLRSIQEARILLEHVEESKEILEGLPSALVDDMLVALAEHLLPRAGEYARAAVMESDYGNAADEEALIVWVLTDLLADVRSQVPVQDIYERATTHSAEVGLSKGIVLSLLPDWIAVPTLISQVIFAIKSKSPIVFSARPRVHAACERVMEDLLAIAQEHYYPVHALGFLTLYAPEGEDWLAQQPNVRVIIDSRECERMPLADPRGKDVYYASIGNNPVFVEETADLELCAGEVVDGKTCCYGMLPGAEQSVVVEEAVDDAFKAALKRRGCYFLSDEESVRLYRICYREDGRTYRELIGKSAEDLARRADIAVPDGTRVLVVERPYVSERSCFSRTKYGPVLSYYVEQNWRDACEKCIELILNSGRGNALSIFSRDPEVVRQFILKKPVGRILVNVGTAMGSTGRRSTLPKTLTVTGWDYATTSGLGVTYRDFVRRRKVGIAAGDDAAAQELLRRAGLAGDGAPRGVRSTARPAAAHPAPERKETDGWFSSLLEDMAEHETKEK